MKFYFEKNHYGRISCLSASRYIQYTKFLVLFFVLMVYCSFLVDEGLKDVKVTLKLKNVTVKEVLATIEKKCEYYFTYNSSHFDSHKKITIDVNNAPLTTVLDQFFTNDTIQYKIIENHIVFYRVEAKRRKNSVKSN